MTFGWHPIIIFLKNDNKLICKIVILGICLGGNRQQATMLNTMELNHLSFPLLASGFWHLVDFEVDELSIINSHGTYMY
jgi:hypothetical protein